MKPHIDLPVQDAREGQKSAHSELKTTKTIIYIAGPIKGLKNGNKAAFAEAAERLRNMGFVVLNPAALPEGMPVDHYMPICLAMVQAADVICMLPGWHSSAGANIELDYAKYQGKTVVTYTWLIGKEGETE